MTMRGDALDDNPGRKTELYEFVTTTHILCVLVAVCALILGHDIISSRDYYPVTSFRIFALVGLVGFVVVLLYNSKKILLARNPESFTLIDSVYLGVSFLLAVFAIYAVGDRVPNIDSILLLPIIVTASSIGKYAGLSAATAGSVLLIMNGILKKGLSFMGAVEHDLILLMIMYVVGWFIGGLRGIEAKHRGMLENNCQVLKEEIKKRKEAEQRSSMLSSALEQSPSIAVIMDTVGNIEYVNKKFSDVTGYLPGEMIGRNMFGGLWGQFPEKYKEMMKAGEEWKEERQCQKKNGEYYWERMLLSPFMDANGDMTHLIKMAEDVTMSKNVDAEMARLERLNLVGEMAAGIGHEIRNPMTTIKGLLQILRERDKYFQEREFFDLMIEELERANSIITEYLSLAKNRFVRLKSQNLNSIILRLYPLITADATVAGKYAEKELGDIPDLMLEEKEMCQLILNLVRNGLEAMPTGGKLLIKTFREGDQVIMAVKDQGNGIEPEVLEKIGTPFFTTKDNGTGLGLAVCYSIVARHNAKIEIVTGLDGTTFFIHFNIF